MSVYFFFFMENWLFRPTLLDAADLTAAWFLLLRFLIGHTALHGVFLFRQAVLLVLQFQESAPLSTHFVVARWILSNAEKFLRVLSLRIFIFFSDNFLFSVNYLVLFKIKRVLIRLLLIFNLSSINYIIWTHANIWFII